MSASGGQGVTAPPTPLPSHSIPPQPLPQPQPPPVPQNIAAAAAVANPLLAAAAREQERVYMELLSRPPYNSDPILAQQVPPELFIYLFICLL